MIFTFGWGIAGAAIATMVSQMISFGILLAQCNRKKGCIPIRRKYFKPTSIRLKEILHAGLPSFGRQALMSVATILLNVCSAPYGDAAIAAMSIVGRIVFLIYSGMLGFGQGFQPVCGYNFGARKYDRVLDAFYFSLKVAVTWLTVLGVIAFVFSTPIITVFRRDDPDVIRIGSLALRLAVVTLPVQAWIVMVNMISQSIGYGYRSSIVSISKQGTFFIPAILILPKLTGLLGIQISQPLSDVLTGILALIVVKPILKALKNGTILPEEPPLGKPVSGNADTE